ncbi:unnamed protein product [Notodromas monacha]|uniref:Transmembrane 9 superfamily member n=1 Tax=Notodromas monacha TaxID=399045 RepID=A0A7R9BP44_9CRUS|nr:unnamed protein product [Notodromas monacha]CAG0918211.1 unnamed protein product [Notodromas monacha]
MWKIPVILVFFPISSAFYLPGLAPGFFCREDYANSISGCKICIQYHQFKINPVFPSFDFCKGDDYDKVTDADENLSQMLFGKRPKKSPIKANCEVICTKKYNGSSFDDNDKLNRFKTAIYVNYVQHWFIDNMPVRWCLNVDFGRRHCASGFPVGCFLGGAGQPEGVCSVPKSYTLPNNYYLFNHVDIVIRYHSDEDYVLHPDHGAKGSRIIGAHMFLRTVNDTSCGNSEQAGPMIVPGMTLLPNTELSIPFSYSVKFKAVAKMEWGSRWDHMLTTTSPANVQWFTIMDTVVSVMVLTGIVAVVLMNTVRKDIQRYNTQQGKEEKLGDDIISIDEGGWKLIHGDVFRIPPGSKWLCAAVGCGLQVLLMTTVTFGFSCFGFVNPNRRGSMLNWAIIVFMIFGAPAGYVAGRLFRTCRGRYWVQMAVLTATAGPGWAPIQFPTRVNQVPRMIGKTSFILRPIPGALCAGFLPFLCVALQLYFISSFIWSNMVFHMFGLLFVAFLLFVATSAIIAVFLCYYQLCAEDHEWWWKSFFSSGSTALYIFLYSIYNYIYTVEGFGIMPLMLYFGYATILSLLCFLLTGSVGFLACFWFVNKIYSFVKVD